MSNIGKYIDRNPTLKTAGIVYKLEESTGDTLKNYTDEEAAEDIIRMKCFHQEKLKGHKIGIRYPYLPHESVGDILSTELKKSRFVAFREKFSEDMYFKKPELGKVYPLHSKPDDITNESTTFGQKYQRSESLYDLVLPQKTPDQVNREYTKWHDKYVLSHKHYFPSEQINRHYDRKSFNPNDAFGGLTKVDVTGRYVRACLTQCDKLLVISKAQREFLEKTRGRLGKKLIKHDFKFPEDKLFGIKTQQDPCNVKALMENINPCIMNTELMEALAHINKLRHSLFLRSDFHMFDFKLALEMRDREKTGYLTIEQIFETLRVELVRFNEDKIRTALTYFQLLEDKDLPTERVNYTKFWKLLHIQYPLPRTGNISTVPDNMDNKDTIYRLLCKDLENKPETTAINRRHIEPIKAETTTKQCISPDIPMRYGLEPKDFAEQRPKEELRRIFQRVLTDESFEEVWEKAKTKTNRTNDLISVDELRKCLYENIQGLVTSEVH